LPGETEKNRENYQDRQYLGRNLKQDRQDYKTC